MCIWGLLRVISHDICKISDPANLPLLLSSFPIYLEEKLIVDSQGKRCPWVQRERKKYKQINNIHLTAVFKNRFKHQFWLTTFLSFQNTSRPCVKGPMGRGIPAIGMHWAARLPHTSMLQLCSGPPCTCLSRSLQFQPPTGWSVSFNPAAFASLL